MAVSIKISKEDVSLEEIHFLFENPKTNFDIHYFDGTEEDYFELEIRGFEDGQERKAKKTLLNEIEKLREKDITGSIILAWKNVDYKGYNHDFIDIGIAGEGEFEKIKTKKDLFFMNENYKGGLNYNLLWTKEEIEEFQKIYEKHHSLDVVIYDKLYDLGWTKEDFYVNPDYEKIKDKIREIGIKMKNTEEKYAYIEKENGERIDLSKYFQEYPHNKDIKIPSIEEKGILKTNARGIFLEKNQLIAIEAPEALWISDEESPLIEKVEAPKCTNLFLSECKNLKVENIKIEEEGSLIMEIGDVYYNNNKNIDDKNYYDLKDEKTTYLIAPNAIKIKLDNIPNLKKVNAPNCEIFHCLTAPLLKEENLIVDEDCHIYLHDKEIMRDAIIVLHTEDNIRNKNLINKNLINIGIISQEDNIRNKNLINKNLMNIGLVSQKEFDGKDENYSILCSKEEIRKVLNNSKTEQDVKDFIYEKLKSTNWNDFKYNPNNLNIKNKISQIAIDLKGASAFIEKENGEKIDISRNIRVKYLSFGRVDELIIEKEQEEGKLVTNVFNIECSNSMITSIEAPEARSIYCENCENLEEIYAPQCTYIYCEEVPLLKEENMNVSYDCEIEGLEKKNQLKR